jgi:hypothetical protein
MRLYVGVSSVKSKAALCQNCVTYPAKLRANTATYVGAPKHIVVAGKSLIGGALVGFGVRQQARAESISKRAPSSASAHVRRSARATRDVAPKRLRREGGHPLGDLSTLESITCSCGSSEQTANCVTPRNAPRSLTGISSIAAVMLIVVRHCRDSSDEPPTQTSGHRGVEPRRNDARRALPDDGCRVTRRAPRPNHRRGPA